MTKIMSPEATLYTRFKNNYETYEDEKKAVLSFIALIALFISDFE